MVHEQDVQSLKGQFTKEIQHMLGTHASEVDRLSTEAERLKQARVADAVRVERMSKELSVATAEAAASRKHLDSLREKKHSKSGDRSAEAQLFRLERDYMNLTEALAASQRQCATLAEQKALLFDQCEVLKRADSDQQQKIIGMKESISLLQRNLDQAKKDRSDLIAHLQKEWDESKQALLRAKTTLHEHEEEIASLQDSVLSSSIAHCFCILLFCVLYQLPFLCSFINCHLITQNRKIPCYISILNCAIC